MRKKKEIKLFVLFSIAFWFGWFAKVPPKVIIEFTKKPSSFLKFKPVCQFSDPNDIVIAQAELCRHGIDVKINGDCGKDTALGICELLCRLEDGYQVKSIYERSHYVDEITDAGRSGEE